MHRAVTNLLSNAIKYSHENSTIEFDLICQSDHVLIRVRDKGIGISKEDQVHLFDAFYRASNVKGIKGTGLGLTIVKQVVEAHGGTLTVESEIDRGSTFTVYLPTH